MNLQQTTKITNDMKQIKNTIDKAQIAGMTKVEFPGRIFVIYTEAEADKAVEYLKKQQVVGVDTETRPSAVVPSGYLMFS